MGAVVAAGDVTAVPRSFHAVLLGAATWTERAVRLSNVVGRETRSRLDPSGHGCTTDPLKHRMVSVDARVENGNGLSGPTVSRI